MPDFSITLKSQPSSSYRVARLMADFDVKKEHCEENFNGTIVFPQQWNIGVIVGPSGSGKTQIAKELWGGRY